MNSLTEANSELQKICFRISPVHGEYLYWGFLFAGGVGLPGAVRLGVFLLSLRESRHKSFVKLLYAVKQNDFDLVQEMLKLSNSQINRRDILKNTPLHYAAANGNPSLVRLFLALGANPYKKNKDKVTPLHQAALNGHVGLVNLLSDPILITNRTIFRFPFFGTRILTRIIGLLFYYCPPLQDIHTYYVLNAKTTMGWTPLMYSAFLGQYEVSKRLVSVGANPNVTDKQARTPLLLAVENKDEKLCRHLVAHGARFLVNDSVGAELLRKWYPKLVKERVLRFPPIIGLLLRKYCPKLAARVSRRSSFGGKLFRKYFPNLAEVHVSRFSPMALAIHLNEINIVKIFFDDETCDFNVNSALGFQSRTILHQAIINSNEEIVEFLLSKEYQGTYKSKYGEVDLEKKNKHGKSSTELCLQMLHRHEFKDGVPAGRTKKEVNIYLRVWNILCLLEDSASKKKKKDMSEAVDSQPNNTVLEENKMSNTNIEKIYKEVDLQLKNIALDKMFSLLQLPKADKSIEDREKMVMARVKEQSMDLDNYLTNTKYQDERGNTILHFAALGDFHSLIDFFAASCKYLSMKNNDNFDILHVACYYGSYQTAKNLVEKHKLSLEVTSGKRMLTPLSIAAWANHEDIAIMLIKNNAKIGVLSEDGISPLNFVIFNDNIKLFDLFLDHVTRSDIDTIQESCDNATQWHTTTPLYFAISENKLGFVEKIIKKFPHLLEAELGAWKMRPLHCAAWHEKYEIIEFLINCGADIFAKMKEDRMAIDLLGSEKSKSIRFLTRRMSECDNKTSYTNLGGSIRREANEAKTLSDMSSDANKLYETLSTILSEKILFNPMTRIGYLKSGEYTVKKIGDKENVILQCLTSLERLYDKIDQLLYEVPHTPEMVQSLKRLKETVERLQILYKISYAMSKAIVHCKCKNFDESYKQLIHTLEFASQYKKKHSDFLTSSYVFKDQFDMMLSSVYNLCALVRRGQASISLKNRDKFLTQAYTCFECAISVKKTPEVLSNFGWLLVEDMCNPEEGRKRHLEALELSNGEVDDIVLGLANAYHKLSKDPNTDKPTQLIMREKAFTGFKRACALSESFHIHLRYKAHFLIENEDLESLQTAIKYLKDAIEKVQPNYFMFHLYHYYLACAYIKMNEKERPNTNSDSSHWDMALKHLKLAKLHCIRNHRHLYAIDSLMQSMNNRVMYIHRIKEMPDVLDYNQCFILTDTTPMKLFHIDKGERKELIMSKSQEFLDFFIDPQAKSNEPITIFDLKAFWSKVKPPNEKFVLGDKYQILNMDLDIEFSSFCIQPDSQQIKEKQKKDIYFEQLTDFKHSSISE